MIWHDVEQNGEEWDALRLGKATASNFGLIMANDGKAFGEPAKRYALQLALEQIKGCKSEFGFSNEHMERGHEQEPIARMLYEEMNFVDVDNGGFFDHETYGDSPDGLVGQNGLVEIKSVIAATHYSTLTRGSFDPAYRWQLVGHLDCSGRDWVDFISYCSDFPDGKQLIVYRLTAAECESEIVRLRARRKDFLELVADTKRRILELE
ncbi:MULTISPECIES: lambda exonuclease family protein [Enterobacter cloacae complex]|uniref:YqaJ viral recombinase family protein n=1 Tax=Enterobacter hormaechei TaxID=158836 RepID=A0A6G4MJG3_9ENTR|nr:lambda exonuclease family protein [Enterobacter hormaechei]QLU34448.1 YqaJ viral recombinase family protein [Enterobacter cloacae]HEM8081280.1 YqaJ viral recombinase family protein [Enterobacter roggenkampii]NGF41324.1 YqaJ viral recombinase family protein [Enterobacter hormaechei]SAG06405.1 putative phage-type endonuclease [Enterobacter hormaechei]VAF04163.1 putative phage-type endonuclease [Enterobacter hormaechei]